ncbi:MAG: LytTR family transcriptional regulator [Clostridia bacterium]|nr:LytTR family transcriptional regulator [Clostridia bacterium]
MKIELQIDEKYNERKIIIQAKEIDEEIKAILEKISPKKESLKVSLDDDTYILKEDEIESVYTENGKVYVKTATKTYLSKKRLYEYEKILSKDKFIRISNSEIVNFNEVRNFNTKFLNTICINFYSGYQTYVSRRYIKKIKEFLNI